MEPETPPTKTASENPTETVTLLPTRIRGKLKEGSPVQISVQLVMATCGQTYGQPVNKFKIRGGQLFAEILLPILPTFTHIEKANAVLAAVRSLERQMGENGKVTHTVNNP